MRWACQANIENWPFSKPSVYKADDFGTPKDSRLHLGLLPQPFCGDLRNAEIYVLLLNPGYGPHDYYGEYEVPEYRRAVLANLKQRFSSKTLPFFFLDPKFAWHGGFAWWHRKFADLVQAHAIAQGMSFAAARSKLGRKVASIELLPYHSKDFHDVGNWVRDLHSVQLARQFVSEYVLPRVTGGDAIAIVTRRTGIWNLPKHKGIVQYSGGEVRGAHLGPKTRGGKAILVHLN